MQNEIDVSHIIIKIENQNNPDDTLIAYNKIMNIYTSIESGDDFQKLAIQYSEDPSVKLNNGNLGYFTALQMVYPFENMAYYTPIGEYSNPFKTRFGYHILKVNDIRPSRGKVQVAHIMIRLSNRMTHLDSISVEKKTYQIYDSLIKGGNWDTLCRQYSEDANTKNNGGLLQTFETGRVVPSFADAAFSLTMTDEISKPVLTPYGWHLIRLINKYPLQSYENLKDEISERVKRDSRSELTHTYLINKLKSDNNFHINEIIRTECFNLADSSLVSGTWTFDSTGTFLNEHLFTIQGKAYSVKDFFNYILHNQKSNERIAPSVYMNDIMEDFIDEKLIEYEKANLEEKYYDYKMLVKEYHEGILLFDLMEKEVWNKALIDTIGLEQYYNQNIDNYKWEDRIDAMVFSTTNIDEIEVIHKLLNQQYYQVYEDSVTILVLDEKELDGQSRKQLDSFYNIVILDSALYLEVSCNQLMKKIFLEHIKLENLDPDKFVFDENEEKSLHLKIVSSSKKSLEKTFNEKSALTLQVESGFFEKGDNKIVDLTDWEPGIYDLSIEDVEYVVYVERIIPAANKKLNEVRGQTISDYQNFLEKEWIKELKNKYSVKINDNALSKIYRQFGIN
jgi:peptidyl-prolyl cis-trans isomerase SurA